MWSNPAHQALSWTCAIGSRPQEPPLCAADGLQRPRHATRPEEAKAPLRHVRDNHRAWTSAFSHPKSRPRSHVTFSPLTPAGRFWESSRKRSSFLQLGSPHCVRPNCTFARGVVRCCSAKRRASPLCWCEQLGAMSTHTHTHTRARATSAQRSGITHTTHRTRTVQSPPGSRAPGSR